MKSNSLEINGLVLMRDGAALNTPLTITVDAGEMLAVHGSNGAGKSTLLKTLAGLLPPLAGSIRIGGQGTSLALVTYIGHKPGLTTEMSVHDNVALWGRISGNSELIDAAMHYFELQDIVDLPVSQLSAGWQQRVALTRLITVQSSLWLLDEPMANLDREGMQLLQSLMQTRMEQGGIIVTATHIQLQGNQIKTIHINKIEYTTEVI